MAEVILALDLPTREEALPLLDRLPELRVALARGIAVVAGGGRRLAEAVDDGLGGREVGVAHPEVDDREPLREAPLLLAVDLGEEVGGEGRQAVCRLKVKHDGKLVEDGGDVKGGGGA